MHAVMLSPRLLRCVQVKTCTQAEIPGAIRIIRNTVAIGIGRAGIQIVGDFVIIRKTIAIGIDNVSLRTVLVFGEIGKTVSVQIS